MSSFKIVANSVAKRGLVPTLIMIWHEYAFDSKYGIHTRGRSKPDPAKIKGGNSSGGKEYQGYSYYLFKKFMKALPINFSESVFVDFGSGKGRVLIMAAEFDFKRISGIEFSEEFYRESLSNIDKAKLSSDKLEIIHGDAAHYRIPDDSNVMFFFNPFGEEIMEKVLKNMDESKVRNPREIYIVYTSPTFENCFVKRGYEKIFELHNGAKNEGIIYKV